MENKISPLALFGEWKGTLVSDIRPLERPYVQLLNQYYRSSVAANLHWLQPFHEVFMPEFAVPEDATGMKDFGSFVILGIPWGLHHELGITLNEALNEVSKELQSVIAREGAKIEGRLYKIEKDMSQVDLWLNNRLRAMVGSLVDLHFWRYKRYRPVSPKTAETILIMATT